MEKREFKTYEKREFTKKEKDERAILGLISKENTKILITGNS